MLGPAITLKQAFQFFDPDRPLEGEWFHAFHVPRPDEQRLKDLQQHLLWAREDEYTKVLFTGPRGSGKTTELQHLIQEMQDTHFVVFVQGENLFSLGDVAYQDVLVSLGLALYEAVSREQGISPGLQDAVDNLRYWWEQRVVEELAEGEREGASLGLNLGILRFGYQWQSSPTFRSVIRRQVETRLSELLERLNHLLGALREVTGKRLLLLVDGLDKVYDLTQARDLFLTQALLLPEAQIVYTIPLALIHQPDFQQARLSYNQAVVLPNIAVRTREGAPWPPGREMLIQVLHRRMEAALLTEEAAVYLAEMSGGVLRELMLLTRTSILRAWREHGGHGPVERHHVRAAVEEVKNTYRRTLTWQDYPALRRLRETKDLQSLEPAVASRLLHGMAILEYNGQNWWDVHPIVGLLLDAADDQSPR